MPTGVWHGGGGARQRQRGRRGYERMGLAGDDQDDDRRCQRKPSCRIRGSCVQLAFHTYYTIPFNFFHIFKARTYSSTTAVPKQFGKKSNHDATKTSAKDVCVCVCVLTHATLDTRTYTLQYIICTCSSKATASLLLCKKIADSHGSWFVGGYIHISAVVPVVCHDVLRIYWCCGHNVTLLYIIHEVYIYICTRSGSAFL